MLNRLVLTVRRKYSQNVIASPPQIHLPKAPIDEYVMEKWFKWENKIAIECGVTGKRLTYKELRHRSKSLGCSLSQLGFKKKTVLLAMPNCPEFLQAFFGALQAGMTISPASPLSTANELKQVITDAGVHCVLTTPDYLGTIQQAIAGSEIAVMCTGPATQEGIISFEQLSTIRDPCDALLPSREEKMEQLALLLYSSGTTGLPKGVRLTHRSVTANIEQISHPRVNLVLETTDSHQDVVPAIVPFSHAYGITIVALRSLKMGAKIISLPKFHPETFLDLLARNKNIVLQCVPPLVNFLANDERVTPKLLKGLRVVTTGAAPTNPEDQQKLADKGVPTILQVYGMTEASTVLCSPAADSNDMLTIGPPLPGSMGKVVDPASGEVLPPGEKGELCFKGPNVMEGYHNNPKATAETVDSEGWLHTGDIGYADEQGNLFVVDRMKDLIKVKGYQVAPAELEALLRQHPKIADAAVTSESCPRSGEVPVALIVPVAGTRLDLDEISSWLGSNVSDYKRPGRILVVEEIPKSVLGKIQRKRLKEMVKNLLVI